MAQYDTNKDCEVDILAVVYQGLPESQTPNPNNIWPHKATLMKQVSHFYDTKQECVTNPEKRATVIIDKYTIQSELRITQNLSGAVESMNTIGTFAHEYGHGLELPDLYDLEKSPSGILSSGIGRWGLMGGGGHNRKSPNSLSGDSPAHMSAWSKYQLGWIEPIQVTSSFPSTKEIHAASTTEANVYKFGTGQEYFLVENRQQTGFDAGLPGEGLAIWHIDEEKATNEEECYPPTNCPTTHYKVALVQADNLWDLENKANKGDAGDLYTNSSSNFTEDTTPNSKLYGGSVSGVTITNISAPDLDGVMTVNVDITSHIPSKITENIRWGWEWQEMQEAYASGNEVELALGDYDGDGAIDRAMVIKPTGQWLVIPSSC